LLYVGIHVICAVVSYWLLVGPIERFTLTPAPATTSLIKKTTLVDVG
jgi:ACS family glucarate transporter-like MFS transporter